MMNFWELYQRCLLKNEIEVNNVTCSRYKGGETSWYHWFHDKTMAEWSKFVNECNR